MRAFGPKHYVPLLKWKRGEQRALKETAPEVKQALTPIFEMSFNPDPDSGQPSRPVAELVANAVDAMVSAGRRASRSSSTPACSPTSPPTTAATVPRCCSATSSNADSPSFR